MTPKKKIIQKLKDKKQVVKKVKKNKN